jgi:hypothetical protein
VCLLAFLMSRPHVVIASAAPMPDAAPAAAGDAVDQQSGGIPPNAQFCNSSNPCESWPVPPLLNLDSGSYAATTEQKTSLRALEAQAVANVIKGHGLTDADTDAVKTWGRYDALAELYTLVVAAVNASNRTTDQQNVADWVGAAGQQISIGAAQAAGREYVKWAGLNPLKFEALLKSDTSEDTLKTFLQQTPLNYDNPNISLAKAGWCIYRSPDPYSTDYKGWQTSPQCNGAPCSSVLGCSAPTPTYDEFVKWGQATSAATILNSAQFQQTGAQLGKAIGVAVAVAAAIPAAAIAPALLVGVPTAAQIAAFAAEGTDIVLTSVTPFTAALSGVAAAAAVVAIVIFAVVTAVIEGMHVIQASELPGQLAELITDSYTTTVDPSTLLTSSDGGTSLYTIFVGAILPEPLPTVCDNSGGLPPGVTFSGDTWEAPRIPLCLNAPAIPEASGLDPHFLVKADGDSRETPATTISLRDSSGVATSVRLSKTWFVTQANGVTTQELRLEYVDWDGKNQIAWLLGNSTDGYGFVSFSPPESISSQTLDPDTCADQGLCSSGESLKFVGTDGRHYSARVRGYVAAVGSPKFSGPAGSTTGIEGSPMTFDANGFTLPDAVGPVKRTWRFQLEGCVNGIGPCWGFDTVTNQRVPSYSGSSSGDTVTHTFGLAGTYLVELTVMDTRFVTATTVFSVTVENVAPHVTATSVCQSAAGPRGCSAPTITQGGTATIFGSFSDAGLKSNLNVTINWGDGTRESQCMSPNGTCVNFPNALQLSGARGAYTYSATHAYPTAGTYYGTVWVNDPIGGSDKETFVVNVVRLSQRINFRAPQSLTYGTAPLLLSATGGPSGEPVTLAVTGSPTVCALSGASSNGASTSATVSLLSAGACIITAAQAGNDTYDAARSVTQSFDVTQARLVVTASSATMTFGAPTPAITPRYTGFVNADGPSSLFTPPSCTADLSNGANAGPHPTQCSGGLDRRYTFAYTAGTLTIEKASTTVGLTSTVGAAVKGQPLTFMAAIAVTSPGSGHPGGTVTFTDGAATISDCAGVPIGATTGGATCITSALGVGSHSVSASYSGDGNFNGSSSSTPIVKTVAKAATTTTLSAPATPPVNGQPATLKATVAVTAPGSGTPTGTITFFDGSTRLGTGTLGIVSGQVQGTFTTSSLAVGRHVITAAYAGDGSFTTSTSSASTLYVNTDLGAAPRQPNGAYDLRNMNLRGAYLVGVSLAGATLNTVNLQDAVLTGADFTGATVILSNLSGANLTNAVLKNATFKDTTFKNTTFTGANLTAAAFTGATLKDAIGLNTATLAGTVWSQTTCPNGSITGTTGDTCVGRW